jgi:hypothetical protein
MELMRNAMPCICQHMQYAVSAPWRWVTFAESDFVEIITPRSIIKPAIFGTIIRTLSLTVAANTPVVIIELVEADGN